MSVSKWALAMLGLTALSGCASQSEVRLLAPGEIAVADVVDGGNFSQPVNDQAALKMNRTALSVSRGRVPGRVTLSALLCLQDRREETGLSLGTVSPEQLQAVMETRGRRSLADSCDVQAARDQLASFGKAPHGRAWNSKESDLTGVSLNFSRVKLQFTTPKGKAMEASMTASGYFCAEELGLVSGLTLSGEVNPALGSLRELWKSRPQGRCDAVRVNEELAALGQSRR